MRHIFSIEHVHCAMITLTGNLCKQIDYDSTDPILFSVDQIFREANIKPNGMVNYEEFVKIVCAPVPDYY